MPLTFKFQGDVRNEIADSAADYYQGLIHQAAIEYIPELDSTMLYCFMDESSVHKLFSKGDWFWQHAQPHGLSRELSDNNLNSLMEHGALARKGAKKYSIRLEHAYGSSPFDFDSLDELRNHLSRNNFRRVVPVGRTLWDTTNTFDELACEVDKLTLRYLFQHHDLEPRH